MQLRFALLLTVGSGLPLPAMAQEAPRFQLERVGDGFLRLDTVTGAIDRCAGAGAAWTCTPVVAPVLTKPPALSDRDALVTERDRLADALSRIAAIAASATDRVGDDHRDAIAAAKRDIDDAVDVTNYAIRRMRDLISALQKPDGGGENGGR